MNQQSPDLPETKTLLKKHHQDTLADTVSIGTPNKAPLISIITAVYNGEKFLEQAIQSIFNQNYNPIEYIIIDGGSSDGTLDIIKRYEDKIAYWVSEPDDGIFSAYNKGIRMATGEVIGLLNCDDWYNPGCFELVAKASQDPKIGIFYGDTTFIDVNSGQITGYFKPCLERLTVSMTISHTSSFIRKRIYDDYYLYDPKYSVAGDYDLFLKLYLDDVKFHYIEHSFASFRSGGHGFTNPTVGTKEIYQIKAKHFGKVKPLVEFQLHKLKKRLYLILPKQLVRTITKYFWKLRL